jgi:hypothetical protein
VWDVLRDTHVCQVIAHDKAVYDVQFLPNSEHVFASVSGDGSVRLFDCLDLDHSTILYDSPHLTGGYRASLIAMAWDPCPQPLTTRLAVLALGSKHPVVIESIKRHECETTSNTAHSFSAHDLCYLAGGSGGVWGGRIYLGAPSAEAVNCLAWCPPCSLAHISKLVGRELRGLVVVGGSGPYLRFYEPCFTNKAVTASPPLLSLDLNSLGEGREMGQVEGVLWLEGRGDMITVVRRDSIQVRRTRSSLIRP